MQFWAKVTGSRSKVASTLIFRETHRCALQHHHTKYQPKIFIRLGDTEWKGISVSGSQGQGRRSHRHDSLAWHTFVPWYILPQIWTKNLHSFRRCRAERNFSSKGTLSSRFFCFWIMTDCRRRNGFTLRFHRGLPRFKNKKIDSTKWRRPSVTSWMTSRASPLYIEAKHLFSFWENCTHFGKMIFSRPVLGRYSIWHWACWVYASPEGHKPRIDFRFTAILLASSWLSLHIGGEVVALASRLSIIHWSLNAKSHLMFSHSATGAVPSLSMQWAPPPVEKCVFLDAFFRPSAASMKSARIGDLSLTTGLLCRRI
jgi:hypothetical protein